MSVRVPESKCPNCQHSMDGAADLAGDVDSGPSPGDLSVCLHCATMLQFGPELQLELISPDTLGTIDDEVKEVLEGAQMFIRAGLLQSAKHWINKENK
jgi:hypothetical protein